MNLLDPADLKRLGVIDAQIRRLADAYEKALEQLAVNEQADGEGRPYYRWTDVVVNGRYL